jgi:hypothetical protein
VHILLRHVATLGGENDQAKKIAVKAICEMGKTIRFLAPADAGSDQIDLFSTLAAVQPI